MAALAISDTPDGQRVLVLSGRLDASALSELWATVRRAVSDAAARPVVVDAAGVDYCDGAGAALLVDLLRQPRTPPVVVRNLRAPYDALLGLFDPQRLERDLDPEPQRRPVIEEIGRAAAGVWSDTRRQIAFVGETSGALAHAIAYPQRIRWSDVWRIADWSGR